MLSDIITTLETLADPERIAFAQRTFPTDLRVIGVTNPNLRLMLRELKRDTKKWEPEQVKELARTLVQSGVFEASWLAYELLGSSKKTLGSLSQTDIDHLNTGIDNWVLTDTFCGNILGFAWREGTLDDEYFLDLQASPDVWQRRIAVVATTALNVRANGGAGDADRTLLLCSGAVDDHHPMITKAVSWALRTLVRWEPEAVENFLEEYEDRLARLVLREVWRKLETGRK